MKEDIILVGGGGHAAACIDVLRLSGIPIAGVIDPALEVGTECFGCPVLGRDEDLPSLVQTYQNVLITVGQIKNASIRKRLFTKLNDLGFTMKSVVSPLAYVSKNATLDAGTIAMHFALVNAYARVGKNCIINTRSVIEHECCVGDHCHIAVGAILCGNVTVEDGVFIGAGAICRQGIHIGAGAVIGCGVRVVRNIEAGELYIGKNGILNASRETGQN